MLLTIDKLIYGGDGLARTPPAGDGRSMAVFVPFVLPGERAEVEVVPGKSGFARGTVTSLVAPSPDRIEPSCPHFARCGGCHYQHIPYEKQIESKAAILRETLRRISRIELREEIIRHPSPAFAYRNRARLRVRTSPEFALGYFRFASHEFLPVAECPISSPLINRVMARLLERGGCECPAGVEEIELFADADDAQVLAWAFCERETDAAALLRWAEAVRAAVPGICGITFFPSRRRAPDDDAPVEARAIARSGAEEIPYRVAEQNYRVSAGAFFQVNRHLIEDLVSTVTKEAAGEMALDLYAGVGLFSLAMARHFHHIFAVEASQTSYEDLRHNAPANVRAVQARIEDYQPARTRPDLVVVDPPRAGLGKAVIRVLAALRAPQIRYVSCDPSTLARDLGPLLAAGYRIQAAHLFDLFPQTYHIESVTLLAR